MKRCDIIIPIWNNPEYTKACIENIMANTKFPYHLILVDNASAAATKNYLEDLKSKEPSLVTLVRNNENLGFVKAVNQGLKAATAPYLCILNNDTVPAPGWLENMVRFAEEHPEAGLINPQCGGHGDTPIAEYAKMLEKKRGSYMEMNQCQGFAMLLRKELVDKIGYLDESFGIGGFDDTDYSMRAHKAGYRSVAIGDAYVYHRLHASFDKAGTREEWVRRNKKIYYDKWGKHLRAGILVDIRGIDDNALRETLLLAYGLAREWTWVHLWIRFGGSKKDIEKTVDDVLRKSGLPPHQNIRIDIFKMPKVILNLAICGKFIERLRKRMRDKRFDAIIVLDKKAPGIISLCSHLLKASCLAIMKGSVQDWEKKGGEIALYLKNRQKEYA